MVWKKGERKGERERGGVRFDFLIVVRGVYLETPQRKTGSQGNAERVLSLSERGHASCILVLSLFN